MIVRTKPISIEAIQWTGENFDELKAFAGSQLTLEDRIPVLRSLNGQEANPIGTGDFLIKKPSDEIGLCRLEEFEGSFERVCALCDQPTTRLTIVPGADDSRKHGICATCEAQGALSQVGSELQSGAEARAD